MSNVLQPTVNDFRVPVHSNNDIDIEMKHIVYMKIYTILSSNELHQHCASPIINLFYIVLSGC